MASTEAHVHVSLDKPIAEYVEQVREALRGDVEALRAAGWVPLAEVLAALDEYDHDWDSPGARDVCAFLAERFGAEAKETGR